MSMAAPLDLYQLRTFHALAQTGSFTRAGQRLNLTQSAVSHALAKLEASVGAALMERRPRDLRLTEEGRLLMQACDQVFAILETVQEDLGQSRAVGRLRLGVTVEFGASILLRHIQPFLAGHPRVEIDFTLSNDLLEPLLRGDLDMAIDCQEHLVPDLDRLPWFREVFVVAASPGLAAAAALRRPEDLADCALLSLDKDGLWWRRFLLTLPEARRPDFRRVIEVNHVRGMINAAVAGMGVLLAPLYSVLEELRRGDLVGLMPDLRPVEDRFWIYQRRSRAGLARHRLLTEYLLTLSPAEFGGT
jgi:DNA-binding transcriptional LysR family regulator